LGPYWRLSILIPLTSHLRSRRVSQQISAHRSRCLDEHCVDYQTQNTTTINYTHARGRSRSEAHGRLLGSTGHDDPAKPVTFSSDAKAFGAEARLTPAPTVRPSSKLHKDQLPKYPSLSAQTTTGAHQVNHPGIFLDSTTRQLLIPESAEMAPKKTKTSDSINSRLALVMKSGKGV